VVQQRWPLVFFDVIDVRVTDVRGHLPCLRLIGRIVYDMDKEKMMTKTTTDRNREDKEMEYE